LSTARDVVRVGLLDHLEEHLARPRERGDEVDVPVGVTVLDEALAEPDDPIDAEEVAQAGLDLVLAEVRVAVGVEQALLGGQRRPGSVDDDRPALEHHAGVVGRDGELLAQLPRDLGVGVVGIEPLTPGVELEHARRARAVAAEQEDRAAVAQPRVVDRQLDDVDRLGERAPGLVGGTGLDDHRHRLELGDRVGRLGVVGLGPVEGLAPQAAARGPGHERALVRRPLRRHREPILSRGWHGRGASDGRAVDATAPPACRRRAR
jgi:hypothetical protein